MIENIRLSFQGIWAHKMRSFLTMLGIIIGIAALISIVSTIAGTNEQIKKNLIGEGDNVIEITLNGNGGEYQIEYEGLPQGVPMISQEQKEEILRVRRKVETQAFFGPKPPPMPVFWMSTGARYRKRTLGEVLWLEASSYQHGGDWFS